MLSRQQEYNYPLTFGPLLDGAPTYNTLTETWDGSTTSAVTKYQIESPAAPADRKVTVELPDKTRVIQYSYNRSDLADGNLEKLKTGLVHLEERRDENNNLLGKTETTWEVLAANKTPRVTRTEVTDERDQTLATSYQEYNEYNGVGRVVQYDYNGTTVLRTTRYTYASHLNANLNPILNLIIDPRLINLVQSEKVYDGDDAANKLAGLTEYKYDDYAAPLQAYIANTPGTNDLQFDGVIRPANMVPGILMHSARFNPLPFGQYGGSGSAYITKRGNCAQTR